MSKRWLGLLVLLLSTFSIRSARANATYTGTYIVGPAIVGDPTGAQATKLIDDDDTTDRAVDLTFGTGCDGEFSFVSATGATCNATTCTSFQLPGNLTVKYIASTRTQQDCTIVAVRSSGGQAYGTFVVSGTGIGPHLATPATVAIGDVRVAGSTTGTANLALNNDGERDMIVTSVTSNNTDFTVGGSFPMMITSGMTANVPITFNPSSAGNQSSSLTITTDGTPQPVQNVNATGRGTNAVIGVSNGSGFGTGNVVNIGTSTGATITISNTAASNAGVLTITGASISPSAGSWITFGAQNGCAAGSTTCTYTGLSTSTSTTIPITCSPPSNAMGTQVATVTVSSDTDAGGDTTGTVTCVAGRADAVPVPAMAMFPDRVINTTSPTTSIVITNMGTIPLTYSLTETDAMSQFTVTMPCSSGCTLNPGISSQPITVAFAPTLVGPQSGNIRITSNDPDGPIDIPLSGNGIAPHVTASLSSPQAFGTIEVGSTGVAKTLTLTSDGTSPLTLSSVALTTVNPNWSITGSIGAQPMAVNDTRTFMINCVPTTSGTLDATLRISSNSAPTNGTIDIVLTCSGNQGTVTLDDTDHDFGGVIVGQMSDKVFRITNTGNVAVNNVTVTPGGAGTGYTILASPFPVTTIGPGAFVDFTVRFMPATGADGGDRTFAFSAGWGTGKTATSLLTVHGDGLIEGYDATPATVNFTQRFDAITTQRVCITNTGDATVNLTAITLTLGGTTQTNEIRILNLVRRACGSALAGSNIAFPLTGNVQLLKNEEVEAIVQFDPNDRVGMMSATIMIMSDLINNPTRTVTVNGTSTTAMLATNPGILVDFGPTDLDAGPQTRDITITNTGVATLDLATFLRSANPLFTTTTLPSTPQHLAMGEMVTITVTYTPNAERPAGQNDSFTISHDIAGVQGGPASQTITIQGRGVDRHIDVGTAPTFPPTFRNPGSRAPVGTITITNTGDAMLDITAIMVSNDDVWKLMETGATQIAGGASKDFHVSFNPKLMGMAPQGEVVFMNNDNTSAQTMMAKVTLDGMGLDRNVALIGDPIDVGTTAIGLPITLENGLVVASMDPTSTFTIREIQITDDATEAFTIANTPTGESLGGNTMKQYDVTFAPTDEGEVTAKALLFLDEDPTQTAEVTLKGRAVFVEIGGGGGCSTSSNGSAGMVLVLGALLIARRRRRAAAMSAATVALALLVWPASARAQSAEQTFDLDLSLFDPTPSTTNTTLQVQSADVGQNGEWIAGVMVANATNPLVIRYADTEHMSITRRTMIEIGGAYAFLDRFEAGLRMPLYNQAGDGTDVGVASPSGTARGDLVAHFRAQLFKSTGATPLVGGASLAVTFPTASEAQYAGVDKPSARVLGLFTVSPGRVHVTLNAGAVIRSKSELQNIRQGSGLAFGGAASVKAIDGLWVFGEIYGEVLPSSEVPSVMASAGTMTTAEWLGGVTYRPDPRVNIGVGAGRGLVSGLGTPDFRAVLALSFTPGRAEEIKPVEPPKPPDVPKDSDGDGVMDNLDACKDEAEDKDGFKDDDGCPDVDNDNDGFMDSMDKCPNEAEDKDGFQDDDGCPDMDNDNDGVVDMADKCPTLAEDKDGFQDDDGCPDKDNDGDGMDDSMDKCPDQAETINGNADDDGCPDPGDSAIALTPSAVELLESIEFKGGELKPTASRVLGQVAATLKAHPEILRIKINVHVNPDGKDAKEKTLTEERAMAIREWLIKAGISADRVSGAGMGGTKPLVKGKKSPINERVEIIILERK